MIALLTLADAPRFGLEEPITERSVHGLLDRVVRDREAGRGFAYAVTLGSTQAVVGFVQVRQLDPGFETAELEIALAPTARGTNVFVDVARLVGSFAFGAAGAHRLEVRVLLQHGRANGAMRKLGAVQEGVLRRAVRRDGRYLDQALWSILKDDWGEMSQLPVAARIFIASVIAAAVVLLAIELPDATFQQPLLFALLLALASATAAM
jgi:ribosomal-protein-alanine N-acetyltransferase